MKGPTELKPGTPKDDADLKELRRRSSAALRTTTVTRGRSTSAMFQVVEQAVAATRQAGWDVER